MMIDRFYNGDKGNDDSVDDPDVHPLANYHGGDIVDNPKNKEGHFSELGINTIWISPIVQGPDIHLLNYISYRKYRLSWLLASRK